MTQEDHNHQGPYLQGALLCEQVLDERDNVKSAIRIVDRVTRSAFGPNPPATMEAFEHQLKFLLKFKSGRARGPMPLQVWMERPSGESKQLVNQTLYFEGDDDRGNDIVINLMMKLEIPGLYWIDVRLDGKRITKVPLRIVYLPQPSPPRHQA